MSTHSAPVPAPTGDVAAVTRFLTAYSNMDYEALKAAAAPDFHFRDQAFPKLTPGAQSLGMFHWFIHDRARTNMKILFDPSSVSQNADGTVTAHYTADYTFAAGFGIISHIVNPITAVFTVKDGLVQTEVDTYDNGFNGWAGQAFGPRLGPWLKDSFVTLPLIQFMGGKKLAAFMKSHPS